MLRLRFRSVQLALCLGFAVVLVRLAYLQLWCHEALSKRAESQFLRVVRPIPRRGPILDREGRPLASSVRVGSCYADPTLLRKPEKVAQLLAGPLQMSSSSILEKIRSNKSSFVWLKRFMSVEEAQAVERLNLFGVGLKWEYRRDYPNGFLAAHVLGFVGMEGQGLSGIEQMSNDWIVDARPPRQAMRDGHGSGVGDGAVEDQSDRAWVKLTLDRTLQYIAERELDWGMQRSRARAGMIVVQDSHTGEVLAMASRPSFSLTAERPSDLEQLQIMPVHWVFEPGSTMKAVMAAAALEENVVKPTDLFDCENGQWKFADIKIHDHEKRGILSFAQVIEYSSNIGTAKASLRLGRTKLHDYLRAFGFGSRTGSEIPGEAPGLLKPVNKWSGVSLPVISFGQEVGVTAIQLACAYSALANGGMLMEPRLFLEMVGADGERREWKDPLLVRRVISEKTAQQVTKILRGVVERGTGVDAKLDGWSVAGKTGTAQKIDPRTRQYSANKFIASFCGFVPAVNPRLTIVVVYDEPQGVEWGGYNAGPVFRNVAWHALTYLGVPPDVERKLAKQSRSPAKPSAPMLPPAAKPIPHGWKTGEKHGVGDSAVLSEG